MEKKKLTHRTWWIILWLVIFFPVGLYLMWKNTNWRKVTKIVVTSIIGIMTVVSLISDSDSTQVSEPVSTDVEAEEEKADTEEKKVEEVSVSIENAEDLAVKGDQITVNGEVSPGAALSINEKEYSVNEDGTFQAELELKELGQNEFTITATKSGMKKSSSSFTVSREMTDEEKAAEQKRKKEEEAKKKAEAEAKEKEKAQEKAKKEEEKKAKEKAEKEARAKAYQDSMTKISGSGNTASDSIKLDSGFAIFDSNHNGGANFIVELQDENGNTMELLINEIGSYKGKTFAQIPASGNYYLNITADGPWNINITQETPPTLKHLPGTIEGSGDDVVFVDADSGNYKMIAKHSGSENFIVMLNGQNLLVNEIGAYEGSQRQSLNDTGVYAFVVNADGNWSITLE